MLHWKSMKDPKEMESNIMKEIWMNTEFNEESCIKLREEILERAAISTSLPIMIYINSPGGCVSALSMILDTLDGLHNPIVTICAGQASSAGAVLLARGDTAFMGRNSKVMIHKASGGVRGTDIEVFNEAKALESINDMMIRYICKKTKKSKKAIKSLLDKNVDITFSSEEALSFGIVDTIGVPIMIEKTMYEVVLK